MINLNNKERVCPERVPEILMNSLSRVISGGAGELYKNRKFVFASLMNA